MLGPRFLQMQGPNHSASGEDERRPTDQGEPVSDKHDCCHGDGVRSPALLPGPEAGQTANEDR